LIARKTNGWPCWSESPLSSSINWLVGKPTHNKQRLPAGLNPSFLGGFVNEF
jgi:hypothetical protein